MAKVIPLRVPHAGELTIPLAGGATLRLVPLRDSPQVMLVLVGPGGGDAGGVILHAERARLLGTWLQRLADAAGARAEGVKHGPAATVAFPASIRSVVAFALAPETTLPHFPRLAVPSFADWCSIDLLEKSGSVRRVAVAAADPLKADVARTLEGYPPDPQGPHPKAEVLRTGRPEIAQEIADARMVAYARDAEHLAILRSLGCRSSLTVPLVARRRVLGLMTFVTAESGRRYREDDLTAAMAFARCAALTVDNSRRGNQAARALVARPARLPTRPRPPGRD